MTITNLIDARLARKNNSVVTQTCLTALDATLFRMDYCNRQTVRQMQEINLKMHIDMLEMRSIAP
jgi:hypothetical protein